MESHHPAKESVRASDAEREQAVDQLKHAAAEGRLTLEELADRTEVALGAISRLELDRVVSDLPDQPLNRTRGRGPRRRVFAGIMGSDTITGPLHLGERCTVIGLMGGVDIDLSQATIEGGELTVRVFSVMGGSIVRVPTGVHVERSGFSLMGGDKVELQDDPPSPDAPVIRIRSFNLMGGNNFRSRHRPGRG